MSSNTSGEAKWSAEVTTTTRAPPCLHEPGDRGGSARSSGATKICLFSVLSMIMVAAAAAAFASEPRAARVTSAPAPANARAVSEPSPEMRVED